MEPSNTNEDTQLPPVPEASPTPQPVTSPTPLIHRSELTWILLIILLLAAVGTGGVYLGKHLSNSAITPIPTQPVATIPSPTLDPIADWKTLTDNNNFTLRYPNTWDDATRSSQLAQVVYIVPAELSLEVGATQKEEDQIKKDSVSERSTTVDGIGTKIYTSRQGHGGVSSQDVFLKNGSITIWVSVSYDGTESEILFDQILSTFKLIASAPSPTCVPRPACLDSYPHCKVDIPNVCPPTN